MKWLKLALSAAILAAAGIAIRYVCYRPVRCHDLTTRVAMQMKDMDQWGDPTRVTVATRENLARLEPCRREMPWNVNLQMLVAANYGAREMHEDAIRVYEDALRYDHRPELYFNLGIERLKTGRVDEAIEPLAVACSIRTDLITEILNIDVRARVMKLIDQRATLLRLPNEPR
jgi:hypothetical protein